MINREKTQVRTLLITGTTGFIGQRFVHELIQKGMYEIKVLSKNVPFAKSLFGSNVSEYLTYEDVLNGTYSVDNSCLLFHLGFARPHNGDEQIVQSLELTTKVFSYLIKREIQGIVNISSRSVYGNSDNPPWDENSPTEPVTAYGKAKLSAERILRTLLDNHQSTQGTSIRLGTVLGGSSGLVDVFVLSKFIKQAMKGETIHIVGGAQNFDLLHIDDVIDAFIALIETHHSSWKPIYTLGSFNSYNIVTMAKRCVAICSQMLSIQASEITIEPKETHVNYGLHSSLFQKEMNWSPKRSLDNIIESMISYYLDNR